MALARLRPSSELSNISSLHGETTYDVLGEIYPILDAQVAAGRRLVLAAPEKDPCWFHPEIVQLIQKFDEKSSWKEDPNVTLDFNLMLEFNSWDNEELGSLTPGEDERDVPLLTTYVADVRERETTPNEDISSAKGASAISFAPGKNIPREVQSSLRRLHQNLGHPDAQDLARHLRLAGASPDVAAAAKRIRCEVCDRNKRGSSARPASMPNLLSFNQVVALDAFSAYDALKKKAEFMIAVDLGTGFCLAAPLSGHSGAAMEETFCRMWSNTFGAPGTLVLDLETGLQKGLARFSEWHGTKIRPIAAQAHWQQGLVERCIRTWKEV